MPVDTTDLPPDVRASLVQCLRGIDRALDRGDDETAERLLSTVRTVTTFKVPDPTLQDRLERGCEAVTEAIASGAVARARELVGTMCDRIATV